jgi:hypothetical protein
LSSKFSYGDIILGHILRAVEETAAVVLLVVVVVVSAVVAAANMAAVTAVVEVAFLHLTMLSVTQTI